MKGDSPLEKEGRGRRGECFCFFFRMSACPRYGCFSILVPALKPIPSASTSEISHQSAPPSSPEQRDDNRPRDGATPAMLLRPAPSPLSRSQLLKREANAAEKKAKELELLRKTAEAAVRALEQACAIPLFSAQEIKEQEEQRRHARGGQHVAEEPPLSPPPYAPAGRLPPAGTPVGPRQEAALPPLRGPSHPTPGPSTVPPP
jgi:hypothetical protein